MPNISSPQPNSPQVATNQTPMVPLQDLLDITTKLAEIQSSQRRIVQQTDLLRESIIIMSSQVISSQSGLQREGRTYNVSQVGRTYNTNYSPPIRRITPRRPNSPDPFINHSN